ncbi:hypothetical protein EDF35_2023 [Rathayibacter sp. PhB151]|uniref:hypothetical protein n=1 Tax=Rathayibacter sp. PhB151 TaxID=2485189 RepID=UPI0010636ADA|nr:hypothetical protein [Rathayibacter sp. PhB151]TDX78802.1 hypothetical protein EDF35_2023 [Rathayibacter sp. PhB151]
MQTQLEIWTSNVQAANKLIDYEAVTEKEIAASIVAYTKSGPNVQKIARARVAADQVQFSSGVSATVWATVSAVLAALIGLVLSDSETAAPYVPVAITATVLVAVAGAIVAFLNLKKLRRISFWLRLCEENLSQEVPQE